MSWEMNSIAIFLSLCVAFILGVWIRNYVFAVRTSSFKKNLVASVPVGLITIGVYSGTAFTSMNASISDFSISVGYIIVFGMLSRESLDRLVRGVGGSPLPAAVPADVAVEEPPQGGPSNGRVGQ